MACTTNATQKGNGHGVATVELRDIPISRIVVAEGFNPHGEVVEDAELQAMAATMRERGCLQPIRVRATETGDFALIAGERRYRAATLAALTTLPAVVLTGGAGDEGEYLDLLTDAMIANAHGFHDAYRQLHGYQQRELSWEWPRWGGGYRLDHLLISGPWQATSCRYLHPLRKAGLSDHSPLLAEIQPAAEPTAASFPTARNGQKPPVPTQRQCSYTRSEPTTQGGQDG